MSSLRDRLQEFLIEQAAGVVDALPLFGASPGVCVGSRLFLPLRFRSRPCICADGAFIGVLIDELPLHESIPAVLFQVGMMVLVFWQWCRAEMLRKRVRELEDLDWAPVGGRRGQILEGRSSSPVCKPSALRHPSQRGARPS